MNYALVPNGAWWQGLVPSALGAGRKRIQDPQLQEDPLPCLSEGPSIWALCLSLGATGDLLATTSPISLCTAQSVLAV